MDARLSPEERRRWTSFPSERRGARGASSSVVRWSPDPRSLALLVAAISRREAGRAVSSEIRSFEALVGRRIGRQSCSVDFSASLTSAVSASEVTVPVRRWRVTAHLFEDRLGSGARRIWAELPETLRDHARLHGRSSSEPSELSVLVDAARNSGHARRLAQGELRDFFERRLGVELGRYALRSEREDDASRVVRFAGRDPRARRRSDRRSFDPERFASLGATWSRSG